MELFNKKMAELYDKMQTEESYLTLKSFCKENEISIDETLKELGFEKALEKYTYADFEKMYNTETEEINIRPIIDAWQRDGIIEARDKVCIYPKLIGAIERVNNKEIVSYYYKRVKDAAVKLQAVAEGAELPTLAKLEFDVKTIKLTKVGGLIPFTYELLKSLKIDLIKIHITKIALNYLKDLDKACIDALLYGNTGAFEDRPIRKSVASYNYVDLLAPVLENKEYAPTYCVCNEYTYLKALADADLKEGTNYATAENGVLPRLIGVNVLFSDFVPDNKMIFVDTSVALVHEIFWDTKVENDRYITNQTFKVTFSDISGFNVFHPNARTVVTVATLGEIDLASVEGEKSGETVVSFEDVAYDNPRSSYVYKTGTSATDVKYGDDLSSWTALPVNGVITPTSSHTTITVGQIIEGKAIAAGSATIVKKA